MDEVLRVNQIELIALAGFMRIMTPWFVRRWEGRMINIHPSLLPLFKGTHTHRQALEAGVAEHGCSVHFVVPELDAGPVIAQARVPVLPGDDEDSLAAARARAGASCFILRRWRRSLPAGSRWSRARSSALSLAPWFPSQALLVALRLASSFCQRRNRSARRAG